MITLNFLNGSVNSGFMELNGRSTDQKPIEYYDRHYIGNGSIFQEVDTGKTFIYDAQHKSWFEKKTSGGGGGLTPEQEQKLNSAVDAAYVQGQISAALGTVETALAALADFAEEVSA